MDITSVNQSLFDELVDWMEFFFLLFFFNLHNLRPLMINNYWLNAIRSRGYKEKQLLVRRAVLFVCIGDNAIRANDAERRLDLTRGRKMQLH